MLSQLLALEIRNTDISFYDCRIWSQKHAQNGFWFVNLSAVIDNTRLSTIVTVSEPLQSISFIDFARCIIQNMVRQLVSHASQMMPLRRLAMQEDPLVYEDEEDLVCVDWKEDGF